MLKVKPETYEKMWKELMLCLESKTHLNSFYYNYDDLRQLISKIEMRFYLQEKETENGK